MSKINSYTQELNQLGITDKEIIYLPTWEMAVGRRDIATEVAIVYKGNLYRLDADKLYDISFDTDSTCHSKGSLAGTLVGGALLGDAGAIVGSGLLSKDRYSYTCTITAELSGMKTVTFEKHCSESTEKEYKEYAILRQFISDILIRNKNREMEDYTVSSQISNGSKKKENVEKTMTDKRFQNMVVFEVLLIALFILILILLS